MTRSAKLNWLTSATPFVASDLRRLLLFAFFFVSGASSLLYQIAWQRLLGLHYGVGAISSAIVISAFMLGLGLGSLLAGEIGGRGRTRSLVAYMVIELGIGLFGIASLPLLGWLGEATAGAPYSLVAAYTFMFLLVPTLLMGATLPVAIQALMDADPDILRNVSSYYYVNTLGASFGCIVASFVLVSLLGLDGTIYAAATLNLLLTLAIFALLRDEHRHREAPQTRADSARPQETLAPYLLYPAVFLSGFIAIGYEIVWFRLVGILLKDSVYTFAIMLGIYLFAIALGSRYIHVLSRLSPWPGRKNLYLALNGAIALAVAVTVCLYYYLADGIAPSLVDALRRSMVLPSALQDLSAASLGKFILTLAVSFGVAAFFIAPPSFLMGASFPLLASLAPEGTVRPARAVARVYFTAVLGNVTGAIVTGFVLLPALGTERTMLAFVLVGLCFFLLISSPAPRKGRPRRARLALPAMLGIAIAVTFPERGDLIRMLHERVPGWRTYLEEGIEGVVLTRSQGERLRNFINGSEHGGRPSPFAYFETITTLSFLESPENVLVIGLGTGSNLEAVLKDPKAKSITLVEINGTAIRNLRKVEVLQGLLEDPRLTVIQDDARRWLRTTDQRFDAIFMDPLRTTSGFSNNLYSQEFFALLRDHLTPNGAVMVWSDEFEVVPRTLATVFPRVEQHCLFMVALSSPDQPSPRPERFGAILGGFDGNMAAEIRRIDCARRFDERQILAQTRGVPINTDYRPVTEYYLGSAVRRLFSRAADAP